MFDMGYTSDDDHSELENQEDWAEMRRLRLYMAGKVYRNVGYKIQLDFADGSLDTKDAYVEIYSKGIPFVQTVIDSVRAGHFKEPFSLEELTSSKYITFIERANPVGAFSPSRNPGIQISKYWDACKAGYQLGVFREADDSESVSDGGYNLTGRAFWAPLYADNGARVIHLGAAYSMRHYGSDEGTLQYRSRGEQHVGNPFLNTADLPAEDVDLFGAEAAWVHGAFSLQGEFIASSIDMRSGQGYEDACFRGAYVQAGYFLTGEHRVYKKGAFSRVSPKQNFTPDGGTGAIELAARYSYLDMTDGNFNSFTGGRAGQLDALTVGVNWYLNPNTRIMVNYVRSCWDVEPNTADATAGWDEAVDTVIVRFQIDF
jgi:phosphate-selective porin OprO/OprP